MRIGVDVDGVMYDWDKTARYMLREILPDSPYTKDGPLGTPATSWNHIQEHVSPDHWNWLWDEGVKRGLFRHGHMYPGTVEAIQKLADMGDVVIITSRPKTAVLDTMAWLAYHRFPVSEVHILGPRVNKAAAVPECNFYIDDKPSNCNDLLATGGTVCIADRPWNRGYKHGHVVRVSSLPAFAMTIARLTGRSR